MLYRNPVLLGSPAPHKPGSGEEGEAHQSVGVEFSGRAGARRADSMADEQAPTSAGVAGPWWLPISTLQFCGKFQGLRSL